MRASFTISIATAIGIMVSPISLTFLAGSAALLGPIFLISILLAVTIHIITAATYGGINRRRNGLGSETALLRGSLGLLPAVVFSYGSRIVFTVCASAILLVTSGYAFTEVFAYWFSSFAFAYLLLAFLLAINLTGRQVSEWFQTGFVLVTVLGLLFLSIVGLYRPGNSTVSLNTISKDISLEPALFAFMMIIGFEIVGFMNGEKGKDTVYPLGPMICGLVIFGVLSSLWGIVSIKHVPADKLAASTIPYMVTARSILGQEGRLIMGIVVITGACSAINALLLTMPGVMASGVRLGILPGASNHAGLPERIPLILLVSGTALLMFSGMAGEPNLKLFMKAGLLLWLLNYAAVLISALIARKKMRGLTFPGYPVTNAIGVIVLTAAFIGLLYYDRHTARLLMVMIIIGVTLSLASLASGVLNRKNINMSSLD